VLGTNLEISTLSASSILAHIFKCPSFIAMFIYNKCNLKHGWKGHKVVEEGHVPCSQTCSWEVVGSNSKGRILMECIYGLQFSCELCAYLLRSFVISSSYWEKFIICINVYFLLEFNITFHLHAKFSFSINSNGYISWWFNNLQIMS
jgi:hypothetical protein